MTTITPNFTNSFYLTKANNNYAMASIAHIINPYKAAKDTDAYRTQQLVFESMHKSKSYSAHQNNVSLYTTQFKEDEEIIPEGFLKLKNLDASVSDIKGFSAPKKYPLIKDILQTLYNNSEADYFVYTNMDIILMPFFYDAIFEIINEGYDAFAINRRRISKKFLYGFSLQKIFAEVGKSHPGFDCFVFKRELLLKFILGNISVGIPFIEASLLYNLIAFSEKFKLYPDKHLTVHIGMEVMPKRDNEYFTHNKNEFQQNILPQLKPFLKAKRLPYAELPLVERLIKWGLNPAVFIYLNTELEAKGFLEKLRLLKDEIRFTWLQKD
jgi:hypothetical protein